MACLFRRSSANSTEEEDFKKVMRNWNPPKVPYDQIYEGRGINESNRNAKIKTTGRTVIIHGEYQTLQLLGRNPIQRFWYDLLHMGLVQVGIKPLTRNGLNNSVLVCLHDGRFHDFNRSRLAVAEFSLNNGPVYFNCYLNYQVPMKDAPDTLILSLEINGFNSEHHSSRDIAVVYKVYHKLLAGLVIPRVRRSRSAGNTTYIETNILGDKVPVQRTTAWDSVEIPEIWL